MACPCTKANVQRIPKHPLLKAQQQFTQQKLKIVILQHRLYFLTMQGKIEICVYM